MSVFLLMLTCFMAIHSNLVLLLLLGLPFDRQLPWHKLMALSTMFHSALHLLAFYIGGRADTMPDAAAQYHLFDAWNRAYGMEVSGTPPASATMPWHLPPWRARTPPRTLPHQCSADPHTHRADVCVQPESCMRMPPLQPAGNPATAAPGCEPSGVCTYMHTGGMP